MQRVKRSVRLIAKCWQTHRALVGNEAKIPDTFAYYEQRTAVGSLRQTLPYPDCIRRVPFRAFEVEEEDTGGHSCTVQSSNGDFDELKHYSSLR